MRDSVPYSIRLGCAREPLWINEIYLTCYWAMCKIVKRLSFEEERGCMAICDGSRLPKQHEAPKRSTPARKPAPLKLPGY